MLEEVVLLHKEEEEDLFVFNDTIEGARAPEFIISRRE